MAAYSPYSGLTPARMAFAIASGALPMVLFTPASPSWTRVARPGICCLALATASRSRLSPGCSTSGWTSGSSDFCIHYLGARRRECSFVCGALPKPPGNGHHHDHCNEPCCGKENQNCGTIWKGACGNHERRCQVALARRHRECPPCTSIRASQEVACYHRNGKKENRRQNRSGPDQAHDIADVTSQHQHQHQRQTDVGDLPEHRQQDIGFIPGDIVD